MKTKINPHFVWVMKEGDTKKRRVLTCHGTLFTNVMKEGYAVYGHGTNSCAKFLKEDKEEDIAALVNNTWISGFMSAAGLYSDTQKALSDVADMYDIQYLIRQYCEKNPRDDLADAAEDVAEQLINRAGRR